jgi:protein-tyrosine phosphatase
VHGYIDLHCHWLSGVDDGARTLEEGHQMLNGLFGLGFSEVVATPHIRPGLFENVATALRETFSEQRGYHESLFREAQPQNSREPLTSPELSLGAEHFFIDAVHQQILAGDALPYRGGKAILIELLGDSLPVAFEITLAALRRSGLVPIVAHPERYRALWRAPERLESWLDSGAAALLDIGALVGKYGSAAQDAAVEFLQAGYYSAACSDAHRASDIDITKAGMHWVVKHHGASELESLFHRGPRAILEGTISA